MTNDDQAILEFERLWWQQAGAKENAIRERFGLTPTRYYQRLTHILDDPTAVQFDPILVRRLCRIRDARRAQRTGDAE